MTRYVWRVSPARRRSRTAIAESRANLREGHAYRTSADRRGRSAPHLLRLRNVCRRRRNLPKRARARLDQRHASVGQPPARAAGLERTALRSIGVVFILWPPRTAAGRKTAPHHRHHQTSPRRYERHDAPGCAALCARRGREIGGRIRFLLASEHDFSSGSFGFGRHSGLRFRHHKEVKPKPNDGDPGKRKERRAVPCLDNHDSGERGG
jgi:hypothetical protein